MTRFADDPAQLLRRAVIGEIPLEDAALQAALTADPQLRAQFGWIDQALADGRRFLFGDAPGLADTACFYLVWFIRARWQGGPAMLAQFAHLLAWAQRIEAIGHGQPRELSSGEAIEIARAARTT